MPQRCLIVGVLAILAVAAVSGQGAPPQRTGAGAAPAVNVAAPRAVLDKYCVTCHNQRVKTAGLMLDSLDVANTHADAETWEKVVRKVRGGLMPPVGMPRPDKTTLNALASHIETSLDRAAIAHPVGSRVHPRRLPFGERPTNATSRRARGQPASARRDLHRHTAEETVG